MSTTKVPQYTLSPLVDLILTFGCVYFSPQLTNLLAPLFGWQELEDINIFTLTPFVAGAAVMAVPLVLRVVGFYYKQGLQRVSTALRQLFTFVVYYLCALALYQSTRSIPMFLNHVILVNMVAIPVLLFLRYFLFRQLRLHASPGRRRLRNVILAGPSQQEINQTWAELPSYWRANFQIVGQTTPDTYDEQAIQKIIEENHVGQLILFGGMDSCRTNQLIYKQCELQGMDIYMPMQRHHSLNLRAEVTEIGDLRVLTLSSTPAYSWSRLIKSVLDRLLALALLIFTSPLWIFAAIGIKLSDPKGPVFYRQMRSGLYGRPFIMWKFRSMYADADQRLEEVKARYGNEMSGPIFKLTNDPRIFPFGHTIRKTSIDELPQLLNILMGDMSIVGPRPLPTYETEKFSTSAARRRLSVQPGLTCFWQIEDRSDSSGFDSMLEKDLRYIDNWSLWLDFTLFLRTIPAVLFGKGAK